MGQLYYVLLLIGILWFTILSIRSLIQGKTVTPWLIGLISLTILYLFSSAFRLFVD